MTAGLAPWAMTASHPRPSSQRASSADVAELMTRPAAFTRFSSAGSGRPKWKLAHLGLANSRTRSHIAP